MTVAKTFHPFPTLPTELRLRIWDLALTTSTLIFASPYDHTEFQGPAPWTTGLSCKEAWRQLQQSCTRFSFSQDEFRPAPNRDAHWLCLDSTILDITGFGAVQDIEKGAAALPLPFKHVLTRTIRYAEFEGGLPHLARVFPQLETLVVLHRDRSAINAAERLEYMTYVLRMQLKTDHVARVLEAAMSTQSVVDDSEIDFDGRYRLLCRYFPENQVTLHILTP